MFKKLFYGLLFITVSTVCSQAKAIINRELIAEGIRIIISMGHEELRETCEAQLRLQLDDGLLRAKDAVDYVLSFRFFNPGYYQSWINNFFQSIGRADLTGDEGFYGMTLAALSFIDGLIEERRPEHNVFAYGDIARRY